MLLTELNCHHAGFPYEPYPNNVMWVINNDLGIDNYHPGYNPTVIKKWTKVYSPSIDALDPSWTLDGPNTYAFEDLLVSEGAYVWVSIRGAVLNVTSGFSFEISYYRLRFNNSSGQYWFMSNYVRELPRPLSFKKAESYIILDSVKLKPVRDIYSEHMDTFNPLITGTYGPLTISVNKSYTGSFRQHKLLTKADLDTCKGIGDIDLTGGFFDSLASPTLAEALLLDEYEYYGIFTCERPPFETVVETFVDDPELDALLYAHRFYVKSGTSDQITTYMDYAKQDAYPVNAIMLVPFQTTPQIVPTP